MYQPTTPPKPKRRKAIIIVGLISVALLALCIGALSGLAASHKDKPAAILTVPEPIQPPAYSGGNATVEPSTLQTFGPGTYEVGKKSDPVAGTIKPGTFILVTEDNCYWARLKDFNGDMDSILANDNLDAGNGSEASARITIKSSDKGLKLEGDCTLGQKGGLK